MSAMHIIHPDVRRALREYRKDSKSFKKLRQLRDELSRSGYPYWETDFDWLYQRIAQKRTREYVEEHPDDPPPQ